MLGAACATNAPRGADPGSARSATAAAIHTPRAAHASFARMVDAGQGPTCRPNGAAFALSLPQGLVGAPTPIKAAENFVRRGEVAGIEVDPHSGWRVRHSDADGGGVWLVSGTVYLHAARLPNATWAIDSGERCT